MTISTTFSTMLRNDTHFVLSIVCKRILFLNTLNFKHEKTNIELLDCFISTNKLPFSPEK